MSAERPVRRVPARIGRPPKPSPGHRVVNVLQRNNDGVYWTRAVCACGYFTPWTFGERNARSMVEQPHAVITAGGRPCPDCGHVHTSPRFGSICIGCPCLSVPAGA
jgi:hypothetical protein